MQKIMVVNAGSSSLKFQMIEMPESKNEKHEPVGLIEGNFERIGIENPIVSYKIPDGNRRINEYFN